MQQLKVAFEEERPLYINFRAGIGSDTTQDLTQILGVMQAMSIKESHILLSSPGGLVARGIELHNFLHSLSINLFIHNSGTIDSIANTVFVAPRSEMRSAEPNARFMFHGVTRSFNGGASEIDMQEGLRAIQRDQRAIADTINRQTKMSLREIKRAFGGERIFTPEEAQKRGIIHEIKQLEIPPDAMIISIFDPPRQRDDA